MKCLLEVFTNNFLSQIFARFLRYESFIIIVIFLKKRLCIEKLKRHYKYKWDSQVGFSINKRAQIQNFIRVVKDAGVRAT